MKLISEKKADSKHTTFTFSHRIKGTRTQITETAMNRERAEQRAWNTVKEVYKDLKQHEIEKANNA